MRGGGAQRLLIGQRPPELTAQKRHRRPRVGLIAVRRFLDQRTPVDKALRQLGVQRVFRVRRYAPLCLRPHVRENIRQRQAEGIAAARARGVRFGRPSKKKPPSYAATRKSYLEGHITRAEAAARMKVSLSTLDKWLREDRENETAAPAEARNVAQS